MEKLKLALLGLGHVHAHNLSVDFNRYPEEMEWIGCADVPPYDERGVQARIKENMGNVPLPTFYDDYQELLKQKPDLAVVCTDIKGHTKIAIEALRQGCNVLLEKPMAINMQDALLMAEEAKKSKAELIVNWPIAWMPAFNKVKELADNGRAGKILRVQYRCPATPGPYKKDLYTEEEMKKMWWYQSERGGGAIMDYAGYGCALSTWLIGKAAKTAMGMKKNYFIKFSDVEDYSAFLLDFGDEVGYLEGSWSTISSAEIPTGPVIYGDQAVIVADRYTDVVKVYNPCEPYQPTPAPDEVIPTRKTEEGLALHLIHHFLEGQPLHELLTLDFNLKVMGALDAGKRSCESHKEEKTGY